MSWQRCPICGGTGTVAAGFYEASGYTMSTTSALRPTCRACMGKGVLLDLVSYTPIAPVSAPTPWRDPWRPSYPWYTYTTTSGTSRLTMSGSN